jgi:hypothetical protein
MATSGFGSGRVRIIGSKNEWDLPCGRDRHQPCLLSPAINEYVSRDTPVDVVDSRQSKRFARKGVPFSISLLGYLVGTICVAQEPAFQHIEATAFAPERVYDDGTTVPVPAWGRIDIGRTWAYVCDDRPFRGVRSRCAVVCYSF